MAYQTDEYGNTYYVPDAQYGGGPDWGSGATGLLSGGATGAQIGGMLGGVPGALIGGGLGALGGGLYGLFTGTQEQDRARAAERAAIANQQLARRRMEQGFADERAALETQRQLAEQTQPGEVIYGSQGRPGLLQMQQAQLAQQAAAQASRNRAALASRGLLGSGMEAATSGALAGAQAAQQAQLQANAMQQYQQAQQARQQQLGQLGLQQAQLSRQQGSARSQMDQLAQALQAQQAAQIAARNQALLQGGLQAVQSGLGAFQQSRAQELQLADINARRKAAGLEPISMSAPFEAQAKGVTDFLGSQGQNIANQFQGATPQILLGGRPINQQTLDALAQMQGGFDASANRFSQGMGAGVEAGLGALGQGVQIAADAARPGLNTLAQGVGNYVEGLKYLGGTVVPQAAAAAPAPAPAPALPSAESAPKPQQQSRRGGLSVAYRRPDQSREFFG